MAHGMTAATAAATGRLTRISTSLPFSPQRLLVLEMPPIRHRPASVRPSVIAHKDSFFTAVYHCRSTHSLARSLAHEMARVELVSVGRLKKEEEKERRKWWNL